MNKEETMKGIKYHNTIFLEWLSGEKILVLDQNNTWIECENPTWEEHYQYKLDEVKEFRPERIGAVVSYFGMDVVIPLNQTWIATDKNGGVFSFTHKPYVADEECWDAKGKATSVTWVHENEQWKKSLQEIK